MKSSWEKMRRKSRIFCTLVTHSIPTMAKARMPTRLALPIRRTSWTLKKMTIRWKNRFTPDIADDAIEVRGKLVDHVKKTFAKSNNVPARKPFLERMYMRSYIETATELATVNMRPMDPPNSGPKLREIM